MRKAGEEQGVRWLQVMTAILLGGLLSLAVCLAVLLLCSIGISKGWLGETSMDKLAIVACVLGGFSGGVLTVKRCGSRALLSGLAAGGAFFLLLLTGGLLFFADTVSMDQGGLGLLSGCLCGGAAAGLLCAGPKKKRRRR
ncbi:TIGR04086 family membrane protein [Intestinimonas timonensis]|uniref:TIGR04086 family membrane protein n=1 Tax=Intestinimonas timonensis TaxID=1689270 RepID=UPI0024B21D33|nr:TIGR04086 family membrane protein [Intestinimonas timonensis]